MPDTTSELRRAFERIGAQPHSEARTVALETLVDAVDAAGEQPLLNELLVEIVAAYRRSDDSLRQLTAFGRLIGNFDTAPEWFGPGLVDAVYWWTHNMVNRMLERHDVPLDSIEAFLVRLRRFYAEAGRSLYPAHQAEHHVAAHLGDGARAARALAAMRANAPDYIDDCKPCVMQIMGDISAAAADYEGALAHWAPMLEGGLGCPVQPHETLAASLLPLLALGRGDQARVNHLHGWRLIADKDEMVVPFTDHVRFCALTGNAARAVELLTAKSRFLTRALDPMFRIRMLEAVQLTAAALVERGRGDVELPGPDGARARADLVRGLAEAERRDLCALFDRRNGNGTQTRLSDERTALVEHPHLPLGLKSPVDAVPAAPEPSASGADLAALLVLARDASAAFADDRLDRWRRVADLAERQGADLEPADEAEALIARFNADPDPERQRATAETAIALLRKAGRDAKALSLEASTIQSRVGGGPEAVRAEAARLLDAAAALPEADRLHALRARTAVCAALAELAHADGDRADPALRAMIAALDAELAALPGERGATEARARLGLSASVIAESTEDAHAAIAAAYAIAVDGGHSPETVVLGVWHAGGLRVEGRLGEALVVAESAVAAVRPGVPQRLAAGARSSAAELAAALNEWPRAELYALGAADAHDRCDGAAAARVARHLAGLAMVMQGRYDAAILVLEGVLGEFAEVSEEDRWRPVDVETLLADAYRDAGDLESAAKHGLEALRLMDGGARHPDATRYPRTAHTVGSLLERLWDEEAAVRAYGRAEQAWRDLGSLPMAARSHRAALWAAAEEPDTDRVAAASAFTALAGELRSARRSDLAPAYRESCRAELAETLLQHARYLGDDPEALGLLRESVEAFGEGAVCDREVEAACDLMDLLAEGGDADAAAAAALAMAARLDPEDHPDHVGMVRERLAGYLSA